MGTHYAERIAENMRLFARLQHRRPQLPPRHRSAVDGITHALAADSMLPDIPARTLLHLDFSMPEPLAAVALGDLDTAGNITWQLSGRGIRARTAMWGSAREAGQLLLEQRACGTENNAVVAWLGYAAPGMLATLTTGAAHRGMELFKAELLELARVRAGDRPFTAVEAHSYGATLAAQALATLWREGRLRAGAVLEERQVSGVDVVKFVDGVHLVDVLAATGSPGVPWAAARELGRPGRPALIFEAVSRSDLVAAAGRLLSLRRRVPGTRFGVDGVGAHRIGAEGVGTGGPVGYGVNGHNSSRFLPGHAHPRYGYRDPGTQSLRNLALITTGHPDLISR